MRKKIKLEWIKNETSRKQSFKKRKNGLVKKVQELTTLCGVSAFIVIIGPGEDMPTVWPSPEEAHQLIRRFRTIPEMERCKKMLNQESYLRERSTKMKEQVQKLFRKNKEKVTSYVMYEMEEGKPLSQFHMSELNSVVWLLEEKMKEINKRLDFYREPQHYYDQPSGGGDNTPFSLPPPTTEEIKGHREFPWEWLRANSPGVQSLDLNSQNFLGGSISSSSSARCGGYGGSSSTLQAYTGDIFGLGNNNNDGNVVNNNVGFQPYRNNNIAAFGEGVNIINNATVNVGNEVDLGYGFFGGGGSTYVYGNNSLDGNNVSDFRLSPRVNFGGLPNNGENQEMGIGSAIENPNYGHNVGSGGNIENLGFGLQSGRSYLGGNNINNNNNNNNNNNSNNVFFYNINYINAGNDAGIGVQGQTQENNYQGDKDIIIESNDGYTGSGIGEQISAEMLLGSNSNGTINGGNGVAPEQSTDKNWNGFF